MALDRPPPCTVEQVGPGGCANGYAHADTPTGLRDVGGAPRAGDFILTHGDEWTSKLIRFGQGLRFRGDRAKYTYWNHCAIVVDENGAIVEALGTTGVTERSIHDYDPTQYTVVRIEASDEDRREAAAFARACVGAGYGNLTVISVAISLVTGGTLAFAVHRRRICR